MIRFLWYEDPFSWNPEPVTYRLNRLVFGLGTSPSILGATIEQSEPEIADERFLKRRRFDYSRGAWREKILRTGVIRWNWSRLTEFLRNILKRNPNKDELQAKSYTTIGSNKESRDTTFKVLGLSWHTVTDDFFFELSRYGKSVPETKRSVLSFAAKLFDPIGFLMPFTIESKITFEQLCLTNTSWDCVLKEGLMLV